MRRHRRGWLARHVHAGGVRFEGDWLPLAGLPVTEAKALLKDAWNISYFAIAVVNGRPVGVGHVLRPGDRLGFSQRHGFKAGDDLSGEGSEAESLVNAYQEVLDIAARVEALNRPREDSLRLMAGMVSQWLCERFGPAGPSLVPLLAEVVKRLQAIERQIGQGVLASSGPAWALTDTEEMVLEALGNKTRKAGAIAAAAGLNHNSHLKATLSSLVKRGILRNGPGGYSRTAPRGSGPGQD